MTTHQNQYRPAQDSLDRVSLSWHARRLYVFDLDGTLRCGKHRLNLLPTSDFDNPRAYDAMNLACVDDSPIEDTIQLMNDLYNAGHAVVILTRANCIAIKETIKWLQRNNCWFDWLIMADYDDTQSDRPYKQQRIKMIEDHYREEWGIDRITAFWDDQIKVCDFIRDLGYTCYHVTAPYETYVVDKSVKAIAIPTK